MRRRFLLSLVILAAVSTLHAEPVTLLGPTEMAMPLGPGTPRVFFAVALETAADSKVEVVGVTRDGQPVPLEAFDAAIVATPAPRLVITVHRDQVREPGHYALALQVPAATANAKPTTLNVSLIRPPAELRIRSPLRITRTVGLLGLGTTMSASTISLDENGSRSGVTPLQRKTPFDLHQADDTVTGHGELSTPLIRAGETIQAPLTFDAPAIGRQNGTITIKAPELPNGKLEQPIEFVSRLTWWWLLPTILLGLGAGTYLRYTLEDRRLRLDALAAASRQYWRLANLQATTQGEDAARQLQTALDTLGAVLADTAATPEKIAAAVTDADAREKEIVAKANEQQASLKAKVEELRDQLGEREGLPQTIGAAVKGMLDRLEELGQRIKDGALAEVEAAIGTLERDFGRGLLEPLLAWKRELLAAAPRIGRWPEIEGFEALVARLQSELVTIDGVAAWPLQLAACRKAAAILGAEIVPALGANVPLLAENVALQLEAKGATAAESGKIRNAADAVENAAHDPATTAAALGDAVSAVVEAMRSAIGRMAEAANEKDPQGRPGDAVLTAMEGRAFAAAANALPAKKKEGPLDKASPPPVASASALDLRVEAPHASAPSPSPTVRIVAAEGLFIARKEVTFTAIVTHPAANPTGSDWLFDGIPVRSASLETIWEPIHAGTQEVRVSVRFDDGSAVSASLSVLVGGPAGYDPAAVDKKRDQVRRLQTIGAAILLTGLGMLMFRSTFIGEPADFFAAFGWGFATDVGFARVLELFKPATDRAALPAAPAAGG